MVFLPHLPLGSNNSRIAPMENAGVRTKQLNGAFSVALHSLLTACSQEEFAMHFSFLKLNQEKSLYKFYTQMMASVHEKVEEEFHAICEESEVMEALAELENLARGHDDDLKQIVGRGCVPSAAVQEKALRSKLSELQHLKGVLQQVEEHNHGLAAQLEAMRKKLTSSNDSSSIDKIMQKVDS